MSTLLLWPVVVLLTALCTSTSSAWLVAQHQRSLSTMSRRCRCIRRRTMIAPQQLGTFETLETSIVEPTAQRRVVLHDWTTTAGRDDVTTVLFETAWDVQKKLLQGHTERLLQQQLKGDGILASSFLGAGDNEDANRMTTTSRIGVDTVIFLEHRPIYTLGTGSDEAFVKNSNVIPVIRMDRGGEVTYHGPGQLTVYPVLDLRHYKQDIHWYVRALEEVVIVALAECGVEAAREPNVTGVWVDNHKVAAVGVKCKKWITQHGLAINVTPDSLANFDGIVPCGLQGRQVGCVNQFLPADQNVTVQQMSSYVKSALEDVFRIQLDASCDDRSVILCDRVVLDH